MRLISIIVPVYNVESFVSKCIDSIIAQSYSNWELILIDDGSMDASGSICDHYCGTDNRIVCIHQENKGVSFARNEGLKLVNGDYIIFLDADDWIEQEMLEKLLEAAERNGADMACCDSYNVEKTEDGRIVRTQRHVWGKIKEDRTVTGKELYYAIFYRSATLWNKLFCVGVLDGLCFNTKMSYGEDTDFLLRAMERVSKAALIQYCGYNYCVNRNGNVVSAQIDRRSLELIENAKIVYKTLNERGFPALGVYRIVSIINQVLIKISPHNASLAEYRPFYRACREAAHYPGIHDKCAFFADSAFSMKLKRKYITFLASPKLSRQLRALKIRGNRDRY